MSARDFALIELDARRLPGWPTDAMPRSPRAQTARRPPEDPRDVALAEQIVIGVIKNLLRLQDLTEHHSGRRLNSIDPLVQKVVAIGLYQLKFLTRVPVSAAVNEAVEQAKRWGRAKAAGFVNAVLRKAARDTTPPPAPADSDPAAYAANVLSHPRKLYDRLARLLPPADALRFCEHDNLEPPTIVRLLPGATVEQLMAHVSVVPHEQAGMYVVDHAKRSQLADWAQRGVAQAQDPTAALVVPQCAIEPGQSVLDRCAGLGTKTLQMQEAVGPGGAVVAVDPNAERCAALRALLAQREIRNVEVHPLGMLDQGPALAAAQFDRILVDAPCSNSGVLARRPEARYGQSRAALRSLSLLQRQIIEDSAPHLKPGGLLVYSTCSIWPEENQELIAAFLARHREFRLDREQLTWPSFIPDPAQYHDGGYYAVLIKRADEAETSSALTGIDARSVSS